MNFHSLKRQPLAYFYETLYIILMEIIQSTNLIPEQMYNQIMKNMPRSKCSVFRYTENTELPFQKANNSWAFLVQAKSTAYGVLGVKAFRNSLYAVSS